MTVRQDKFKVGDKVTWADDHYANLTDGRARFGNGPFVVIKIDEVFSEADIPEFSHFVGHTQWLHISAPNSTRHSGAFFKKV